MDHDKLLSEYRLQILKGIEHLSYSLKKVTKLSTDLSKLSTQELESWEGFVARFARVSDIFLSKYVRTYVLKGDPAFRGTLRDFVNQAEKMELIEEAEQWMTIRELRNMTAHEYSEKELARDFEKMKTLAPLLISLKDKI
jgi:hypothetical protein